VTREAKVCLGRARCAGRTTDTLLERNLVDSILTAAVCDFRDDYPSRFDSGLPLLRNTRYMIANHDQSRFSTLAKQRLLQLDLVNVCGQCSGTGKYARTDYTGAPREVYCEKCNMEGVVLNETGELLGFLLRARK
jgi:superfamily II helicase